MIHDKKILILFLILLAVLATHVASFRVPFIYDDIPVILETPELGAAANLPKVFSKSYYDRFHERTWRPVVTSSYFVDSALWRMNPKGFHLTGLLLHLGSTALVYAIGLEFFGGVAAAAAAALLFGIHPVQVESIALISNRKELLGGMFFFLAFLLFLRAPRPRVSRTPFVLLAFLAGLWSMEMTAVLPAVLLMYLWLMNHDSERKWIITRNAPVLALMGLMVAGHLALLFGPMRNPMGGADLPGGGFASAASIMPRVFVEYIRLLVMPHPLCADYVLKPMAFANPVVIASIAFLVVYIAIAFLSAERHPRLSFMMLFVPVALLPVSNIIPFGATMAERYLYIPLLAVALGFGRLAEWLLKKNRAAGVVLCAIVIGVFSVLSMQRYRVWMGEEPLWRDTISCAPLSAAAHMNLGNVYLREELPRDALREYDEAEACPAATDRYKLSYNKGLAYMGVGNRDAALKSFQHSVELYPAFLPAWQSMARMWASINRHDMALYTYKDAIRSNPNNPAIYYAAGIYLLKNGTSAMDFKASAVYLSRAAELRPDDAMTFAALGAALMRIGDSANAKSALRKAIRIDPTNMPARAWLRSLEHPTNEKN